MFFSLAPLVALVGLVLVEEVKAEVNRVTVLIFAVRPLEPKLPPVHVVSLLPSMDKFLVLVDVTISVEFSVMIMSDVVAGAVREFMITTVGRLIMVLVIICSICVPDRSAEDGRI